MKGAYRLLLDNVGGPPVGRTLGGWDPGKMVSSNPSSKERSTDSRSNVDGLRGPDAECSEAKHESPHIVMTSSYETSRRGKSLATESR